MYLVFSIGAGLIGGIFSILIRMELQNSDLQIFTNTHTYNVFVTGHGLIMIFFTDARDAGRVWQLDGSAHDRGAGYGVSALEQLILLVITCLTWAAHRLNVC